MDYKKQTIRILSYIHSQNHSVLPIALLLAWMESLTIYLNLHLMAGVLDRLLEKDWKGLLIWLVILVGFELVWGLLVDGLSEYYWFRCVARLTWDSMGRIYEKAMTIDYTFLEDPKQMEKLNSAKFNLQHTGGFGYFLMYCQQLFRQIFTILVAGTALLELCIKQGGYACEHRRTVIFQMVLCYSAFRCDGTGKRN